MNSNRLTNLPAPTLPHEAANKLYVDGTPRKVLQGFIPPLMASGRAFGKLVLNDKFGFVVTASSFHNNLFHPINAFVYMHHKVVEVNGQQRMNIKIFGYR